MAIYIKQYYEMGLYTKDDVKVFVPSMITSDEYKEITGEEYVAGQFLVVDVILRLLSKMSYDHSFIFGFAIAIPTWLFSQTPTVEHAVMIGILIFTFVLDWLTGVTLAHKSTVVHRTSHVGINAFIRDFIIVLICAAAIGLDFVFETKSFVFAFFTGAFIWQNFYSFLGNVAALGWGKYYPMWLFKLIQGEMIAKLQKYFPDSKDKK